MFVLGLAIVTALVAIRQEPPKDDEIRRVKRFSQEIARDVKISRHGLYGINLIRWLPAAEKLPTHQNEDDAASAAKFSFWCVGPNPGALALAG